MLNYSLVLVLTMCMISNAADEWQQMGSLDVVLNAYPERIETLFSALDLEQPGLAAVKAQMKENPTAAAQALLAYYREADTASWWRQPKVGAVNTATITKADAVLADTFTFYGQTDRAPRNPDGGLKWLHYGPANDWEWSLALNRHFHLRDLLNAWLQSGEDVYGEAIDAHLRDWIAHSMPYPAKRNASPIWRGLEVSFRVKQWARVFHAMQESPLLQDGTRLLMLTSLLEHGHYLRTFHSGNNWATMELSGLATIAAGWPEFSASREWMDYAKRTLTEEFKKQVYPDGVQKELTASYHWVSLRNFDELAQVCRDANEPLPKAYTEGLEAMYNYLAMALRPDGAVPLNNDSDRNNLRQAVLAAAEQYDRADWRYAMTHGEAGTAPDGPPSALFGYAGQLVSRSGWTADAHWSFFDIGPWGTAHQHNDKLHLSVHAGGRDLLVDSGRFAYSGSIANRFRKEYGNHSRGHNVILIDGAGQNPNPSAVTAPLPPTEAAIHATYDYARGAIASFEKVEGEAEHLRALVYLRGRCWIVVDRITTDRPRDLSALWHFHPDCTVQQDGAKAYTSDAEQTNLLVAPAGGDWKLELVSGQDKPHPQGWYSPTYNTFMPSTAAVHTTRIESSTVFAWLLLPGQGTLPEASIELTGSDATQARVVVRIGDEQIRLAIPLAGGSDVVIE